MFDDHDEFAWFREREPIDNIGHSILLYEVEPYGKPLTVLLPNMTLQEIAPDLFATNQVRPIFYNPTHASIQPAEPGYMMRTLDEPMLIPGAPPLDLASDGLWSFIPSSFDVEENMVETSWRVNRSTTAALRIYVHALNDAGEIVSQSDRLDVHAGTLMAGDVVTQRHELTVGNEVVAFRVGLYDWQSAETFGEPVIIER